MIPDYYLYQSKDSLAEYVNNDEFNGALLEALMDIDESTDYPSIRQKYLTLFNSAYLYATKALFLPYPELCYNEEFIEDCRNRFDNNDIADIVLGMAYCILFCMKEKPGKINRFCKRLNKYFDDFNGKLWEFDAFINGCYTEELHSEWDVCPPIFDVMINEEFVPNWYEATNGFNLEIIRRYYELSGGNLARMAFMESVMGQYQSYIETHPEEEDIRTYAKIGIMHSAACTEFNSYVKEIQDTVDKMHKEEDIITGIVLAEPQTKYELQERLAQEAEANADSNSELELEVSQLKDENAKLQEIIDSMSAESESEAESVWKYSSGKRTQAVVIAVLCKLIKKCKEADAKVEYSPTEFGKLISYLSGYSYNKTRQLVDMPAANTRNGNERYDIEHALKNFGITMKIN